jgi:hypothetical protein
MQSASNSTASSFSHGLAAEPIVQSTHKTWQDYLKESSEEQVIDGTIDEKRGIQERLRHVEMYYQRCEAIFFCASIQNECLDETPI